MALVREHLNENVFLKARVKIIDKEDFERYLMQNNLGK